MQGPIDRYEAAMAPARAAFVARMAGVYGKSTAPRAALFLMNFCRQGVGMTRDVPTWMRLAGEAAQAKGYESLGKALVDHAAHEVGHHELMDRDVDSLVAWWNERFEPALTSAVIRRQPEIPAVDAYRQLHLDVIAGTAPYQQIAIELEIERLSVEEGPKLFRRMIGRLDLQVVKCLSFLTEHVAIDAGHTRYNRRVLSRFLAEHPEALAGLVAGGTGALDTYAGFIEGCASLTIAMAGELDLEQAHRRRRPLVQVTREKLDSLRFLVRTVVHGRLAAGR